MYCQATGTGIGDWIWRLGGLGHGEWRMGHGAWGMGNGKTGNGKEMGNREYPSPKYQVVIIFVVKASIKCLTFRCV